MTEVARVLRVTLGDLIGAPVLVEDDQEQDDVPAIRDALMTPRRLSRILFADHGVSWTPDLDVTRNLVESSWSDYQGGNLGRTIAVLPHLIRSAQAHEQTSGEHAPIAWAASARVHHLAATTLSKIGESDLAWIAAERAMGAADRSDDPLVLASAARAGTHALLSVGRYDDALELGLAARAWLAPRVHDSEPAALSLLGMLDLRMAIAAARRNDRATASAHLDQAAVTAERLGQDANYWQTAFGPTNVMLHRVSVALDLGDVGYVAEHGPRINPEPLPTERQVCHHINVARAYAELARDEEAIDTLLSAEQQAPQFVRHHPGVRETVRSIHRRSTVTMGGRSSLATALAERCRAIQ